MGPLINSLAQRRWVIHALQFYLWSWMPVIVILFWLFWSYWKYEKLSFLGREVFAVKLMLFCCVWICLCFLCHWYLSNIMCLFCLARFSQMSSVSILRVVKGEIWARTTCRLNSRFSKTIKVRQFPTGFQKMTGGSPEVHFDKRFTLFDIWHLTFTLWLFYKNKINPTHPTKMSKKGRFQLQGILPRPKIKEARKLR